MNLPNFLTCLRLFLSVFFAGLLFREGFWMKFAALGIFVFASLTDYWDGWLARMRGDITTFGRLMDPIADKVLTLSAFLSFAWLGLVPFWMVLVIVVRDVGITWYRLGAMKAGEAQSARKSGKQKTVLQISFIVAVLIFLVLREVGAGWPRAWTETALGMITAGMFLITALTLWSGVRFVWLDRDLRKKR